MYKRNKMYMATVELNGYYNVIYSSLYPSNSYQNKVDAVEEFNRNIFKGRCACPYDIKNIWLIPATFKTGVYEKQ